MHITETAVPGTFVVNPAQLPDERGTFFESLRASRLAEAVGRPFVPRQINFSVSRRNTLRGLHGVAIPPGQAKYVTCVRGALRDIVVDLRVGSPAFGRYTVNVLNAESGRALYIPEGVGHGFLALTDDTCICYVLSSEHVPGTQIDINPLDADLALPWGFSEPPLMSAKDAKARSAAEAESAGLLATWREATQGTHSFAVRKT
ncbi:MULTISPECIES: dTDP-4-dehydrorhamnose 3,5-epimerase family protein [unclassified Streptomyces]|uniref:dTDP-4-dehydrorhamnose 3,5-epimerase family protein n=1 Tax=Streptomyces johnsoniae TaxID=3075532 RepID=A0ABU2SBZ6_9ACTN|nr:MULTISPECIES: dTDP-4-dehydrorhamnose 3,5-epimerase family protein [unclassified Streptomyces]MDT0446485.1 dTDP-4-dehydrorhamnose 3,5-epimerase family protein [Streptomyces sp. DSM 41886]ONK09797.1 dTDP-4-dehydrorhamnose 3,5-epimerase [Streptomyces sp. MP131-18]